MNSDGMNSTEVGNDELKKQKENKGISTADDASSTDVTADIKDLNFQELLKKAKAMGLELTHGMKKIDVIKLITNQKG